MTRCAKCGGSSFRRYVDQEGAAVDICNGCEHPRQGDPVRIHDLLNGRTSAKPLAKTCHACGGAVLDAPVCSKCIGHTKALLRLVPMLADELDTTIARQTRFAEQAQRVKGTAEPPLPIHPHAADTRDHLRAVMVSWVKFREEEIA